MKIKRSHLFGAKAILGMLWGAMFLVLSSCHVFKSKGSSRTVQEKDSLKTDFFQNVISRYNILHNANIMLDQERRAIHQSVGKNYQIRLSVFDEPTALGDPHQEMDSLIQKAYKIVNTKQESKYINDAYFVIGRAYYFKGAYYTAAEFFEKLIHDQTPEQRSLKALAYAWKSRALLQINKQELAGKVIDSAFMFLDGNKWTNTFVNAAKANYLVRIGEEERAIPFLEHALRSNRNAPDRYRWRFLLAQLYHDAQDKNKASALFRKLANSNVPFDMAFEAGLQAAFLSTNGASDELALRVKPFLRMLHEGKNTGYRDQILFEVGKIYLDAGQEPVAMGYFNKSLQSEDKNAYQQTETYHTLGSYFFQKGLYRRAQSYYDSTATVLPADYTDVNKLRRKLTFMSELTIRYEQNLWQDTLILLGKMGEDERSVFLSAIANKSLSDKRQDLLLRQQGKPVNNRSIEKGAQGVLATPGLTNMAKVASVYTDNRFYFNNNDALLLGSAAFKRRWGNRQLKDDWRFSADNSVAIIATVPTYSEPTESTAQQDTLDEDVYRQMALQRYTDSIPVTDSDFAARHKIIHDNMIAIGNIYRDYTRDHEASIIAYEGFLERFPDSESAAEVHYALYRMYDSSDHDKSLWHKEQLMARYPRSVHALLAKDPDHLNKLAREKQTLDRAFERLFSLYTTGDHVSVIKAANEALDGSFREGGVAVQIAYLKALAIGRVGRVEDFTHALGQIVQQHPKDSLVVPLAIENLAFIDKNPDMFVNRVNALQDKDNLRVAFIDEPDMTPWPALSIAGDYRTGVAIAVDKPKEKEDPVVGKTVAERKEIELLLAREMDAGKSDIRIGALSDKPSSLTAAKERKLPVSSLEIEAEEVAESTAQEIVARAQVSLERDAGAGALKTSSAVPSNIQLRNQQVVQGNVQIDFGPNDYRDKKLFPDTAQYFFVVNVLDPTLNLAPSRYGIGQFNRSRYARAAINHQLKLVNAENQLLFVGPFETFEEVKTYETRILPLLAEIMKVPQEDYNTFLITREAIGTLTDGIQIKNYHQVYIEQ